MDRNDPNSRSGDPESRDGAHVAAPDTVDQAELPDPAREARKGQPDQDLAGQEETGVNLSSDQDPPIASAG